jgi:hypothetical protein
VFEFRGKDQCLVASGEDDYLEVRVDICFLVVQCEFQRLGTYCHLLIVDALALLHLEAACTGGYWGCSLLLIPGHEVGFLNALKLRLEHFAC